MRTPLLLGDTIMDHITVHSHLRKFEMEDIHALETVAGLISWYYCNSPRLFWA